MPKILEKVERRLGERLFLKGERCAGPRCSAIRRASSPGARKKTAGKRKKALSEFGLLMREKQKARFFYGLDDNEIERYSQKAAQKGLHNTQFLRFLESRLDTAVRHCGFAVSQREARHLITYGHILVNNKKVTIPSYQVKMGDVVAVRERSLSSPRFADLDARIKKHVSPQWIVLDAQKKQGTVAGVPEGAAFAFDTAKIKEFYSR